MKNRIAKQILLFERLAADNNFPNFELATRRTIKQFLALPQAAIIRKLMPDDESRRALTTLLIANGWNKGQPLIRFIEIIINKMKNKDSFVKDIRPKIPNFKKEQFQQLFKDMKNIYIVLDAIPKINADIKNNVNENQIISNYFTVDSPLSLFISSTAVRDPRPEQAFFNGTNTRRDQTVYSPNENYSDNNTHIYSLFHTDENGQLSDQLDIVIPNTIAQTLSEADKARYKHIIKKILDADSSLIKLTPTESEATQLKQTPEGQKELAKRIKQVTKRKLELEQEINTKIESARIDNTLSSLPELQRLTAKEKRDLITLIKNGAQPTDFNEINQDSVYILIYDRLFFNTEFDQEILDQIHTYFLKFADATKTENETHIANFSKQILNKYKSVINDLFIDILKTGYSSIYNNYNYIERRASLVKATDQDKAIWEATQKKYQLTLYGIIRKVNRRLKQHIYAECEKYLKDYSNDTYVDSEGKAVFKDFAERKAYILPVVKAFFTNENVAKYIYDSCHVDEKIEEVPTKNDPTKTRKTKVYSISDQVIKNALNETANGKYFASTINIEKCVNAFLRKYDRKTINNYFKQYSNYPTKNGEDIPADVYDTYYDAIILNIKNKMTAKLMETAKKVCAIVNNQVSSQTKKKLEEIKTQKEQLLLEIEDLKIKLENWRSKETQHDYMMHPEKYDLFEIKSIQDQLEKKQNELAQLDENYATTKRTYQRYNAETQELFNKAQNARKKKEELKQQLENGKITKKEYNKRMQEITDAEFKLQDSFNEEEIKNEEGIVDVKDEIQDADEKYVETKIKSQNDSYSETEDEEVHTQMNNDQAEETEAKVIQLINQYMDLYNDIQRLQKEIDNIRGDSKFKAKYERRKEKKTNQLEQLGNDITDITKSTLEEALEYYAPDKSEAISTDALTEYAKELAKNDQELNQSGNSKAINFDEDFTESLTELFDPV